MSRPAPLATMLAPAAPDDVVLVDRDDHPRGHANKLVAHRDGLTHRAISVLIRDAAGAHLVQRRALTKYHTPGLWTNACCSHPRPGEEPADAAVRRVREELGLDIAVTPLFVTHYRADVGNGLIEDEFVHAFAGFAEGEPVPDPVEVAEWRRLSSDELRDWIAAAPQDWTPWLRIYAARFPDLVFSPPPPR